MRIQRFAYIVERDAHHILGTRLKAFNQILNFAEEFILYLLPASASLGKRGYYCICLNPSGKDSLIELDTYSKRFNAFDGFLNQSTESQKQLFLQWAEEYVQLLSKDHTFDKSLILTELNKAKTLPPKIEQVLNISKWHPSRKFRVEFAYHVIPSGNSLIYRVVTKEGDVLDENVMDSNPSWYFARDYKKSKWEENTKLRIYNHLGKRKRSLCFSKHMKKL